MATKRQGGQSGIAAIRRLAVAVAILTTLLGLTACGTSDQPAGERATTGGAKSAAQPGSEAAAAAQQQIDEAVRAVEGRLNQLKRKASELRDQARIVGPGLDEDLDAMLTQMDDQIGAAERKMGELRKTGVEGLQGVKSQLERSLSTIESGFGTASAQVKALVNKEEEKSQKRLETKEQVGELPAGVVAGLDGEEYLTYSPSLVEKVKRSLKDRGYYQGPIDGNLDDAAMLALARFQERNKLGVSGLPTPATRKALFSPDKPA